MSFQQIVKKAGECIKIERLIGDDPNPRFEVFTAPSSICSEKVRSILLMKGLPFLHHDVDLFTHENYHPDYVKMRSLGRSDLKLVGGDGWTGSTSGAKFGFDPLVVPTLVDHHEQKVVVDSKRIVEYIEAAYPHPTMCPEKHRGMVEKHVALVDDTPHAGLLYMKQTEGIRDSRPAYLVAAVKGAPDTYIAAINKILSSGDVPQELRPLYQAKLEKTINVKKVVETVGAMDGAVASTVGILKELDRDLASQKGPWICGEDFTMADIVWHVSIVRFQTFGLSYLFEDLPNVVNYAARILRHPTLVRATYSWPGYIPSPYLNSLLRENAGFALKERNRAMVVLLSFVSSGPKLGLEELAKYLWNDGVGAVVAGGAALAYNVYCNM